MEVKTYPTMWAYGHHFRVESAYHVKQTCDCGAFVAFNQTSHANSRDTNPIEAQLDYVFIIHEIIKLDYRSFRGVIFKCKWLDIF
jgi:hypothetical protein